MCTWDTHHIVSEYTTHKDLVILGECILCVPEVCLIRTQSTQIDILDLGKV